MTLVAFVHGKFSPISNKKWSIKRRTGIAVASAFESPWNCWFHLFLHLLVLVYQERTVQTVRNTLHLLLVDSCSAYVIDHFRCIQQMFSQLTTGWRRLFWWAPPEPKRMSIQMPTRPQLRRKLVQVLLKPKDTRREPRDFTNFQFFIFFAKYPGYGTCGLRNFHPNERASSTGNLSGLKNEDYHVWTSMFIKI